MARILLADDDQVSRDLVRRALETEGHSVVTVEDGSDALAALQSGAGFDVVVTDVQMPGLDGISLAEQALLRAPGTRLVLMSGYLNLLEKARTLPAKHLKLMTKPFTIDAIRAEIRAILAG